MTTSGKVQSDTGGMSDNPLIIGRIGNDDGCECQRCGKKFLVDIMVSDHSFAEISDGKNLLCGHCIITSLESNGFGAFDLVDIDIISRLIPALTNVCQVFDGWRQDGTVRSAFDVLKYYGGFMNTDLSDNARRLHAVR